jgi:hypothetical protein
MRAQRFSVVLLLVVVLMAGCSRDPNARHPVSGTVFLNGQPLDQGRIYFVPVHKGSSESGATILNGKYSIPCDLGLVPGIYKVSIFSYDPQGAKVASDEIPGDPGVKQFKERIPARYNVQTTLTAEVTSEGSNILDFALD